MVAQGLSDSILAGWTKGAFQAFEALPADLLPPVVGPPSIPPPRPPRGTSLLYPDGDEPILRFPGLERAARQLIERRILAPQDFYALSAAAKQQAFTISGDLTAKTIERVRDLLVEDLQRGTSRGTFNEAIYKELPKLPISESHLETVYRSAVNEAFSHGQERILDIPAVADAFPFRAYFAIHDARARKNHLALETLGLDGTNVYWADDPTWYRWRPPNDFGCRCGWAGIDIKTAARLGVKAAQEWLATGIEPQHVFVPPPPFEPSPQWDRMEITIQ